MDVVEYWNNPRYSTRRLARQGTTSVVATVVFQDGAAAASYATCRALHAVVGREGQGAVVRGIHAEGPCVRTLGGLPDASTLASGRVADFARLLDACGPSLRVMTISPTLAFDADGASRLRALQARGIRVALGHDKECTEDDILRALRDTPPGAGAGAAAASAARMHLTHGLSLIHI